MNNLSKNKLLEEIKGYLDGTDLSWDKEQIINEDCVKGIDILKGKALDELSVCESYGGDEQYLMCLQGYTEKVFNNVIQLICNVLDSYKDK